MCWRVAQNGARFYSLNTQVRMSSGGPPARVEGQSFSVMFLFHRPPVSSSLRSAHLVPVTLLQARRRHESCIVLVDARIAVVPVRERLAKMTYRGGGPNLGRRLWNRP